MATPKVMTPHSPWHGHPGVGTPKVTAGWIPGTPGRTPRHGAPSAPSAHPGSPRALPGGHRPPCEAAPPVCARGARGVPGAGAEKGVVAAPPAGGPRGPAAFQWPAPLQRPPRSRSNAPAPSPPSLPADTARTALPSSATHPAPRGSLPSPPTLRHAAGRDPPGPSPEGTCGRAAAGRGGGEGHGGAGGPRPAPRPWRNNDPLVPGWRTKRAPRWNASASANY